MAAWTCNAGDTLLIPSGPGNKKHLHIILNNPIEFVGYINTHCILVGISTVSDAPFDDTCVIAKGSHDFITNDSYAAYNFTRFYPFLHLQEMVRTHTFIPNRAVDKTILDMVLKGLYKSKRTPKYIKNLETAK